MLGLPPPQDPTTNRPTTTRIRVCTSKSIVPLSGCSVATEGWVYFHLLDTCYPSIAPPLPRRHMQRRGHVAVGEGQGEGGGGGWGLEGGGVALS